MSGGSAEIFVLPSGQCVGSQRRLIRSWIERFYPEFCNSFVSIACFAKSMTSLVAVYFLLTLNTCFRVVSSVPLLFLLQLFLLQLLLQRIGRCWSRPVLRCQVFCVRNEAFHYASKGR